MTATAAAASTLDLAQVAPARHHHALLRAFDDLEPDERMIVVAPYHPRGLLAALQIERWGRFEWSPLSDGPQVWRVEVGRRSDGRGRRVGAAMEWDHERLEHLESAAFEARADGRLATARILLGWFLHGLVRHIRLENEVLFPEYARRCAGAVDAELVRTLRNDHEEIVSLLRLLYEQIDDPEAPVGFVRRDLRALLERHEKAEARA
ncbi:MAG TPA: DUF2249 domain-containing protein, partial [Vicinamibacteria bacterium]|nr:DUF2249 domain-containing protein [Vicinamibacteria bacterium]